MTQAEMARHLGMSRATISRLENGTAEELGLRKLSRACALVGLEIEIRTRGGPPPQGASENGGEPSREVPGGSDAAPAGPRRDDWSFF
jgi:transcriptional regulator with XRE-family HTH domain